MDLLDDAQGELAQVDYMLYAAVEMVNELQNVANEYHHDNTTALEVTSELTRMIDSIAGLGWMLQDKTAAIEKMLESIEQQQIDEKLPKFHGGKLREA
ncbi:hypothetical protein [Lactiplantibacillus songbeiensis]|uniref:Uncharacterized protein n=1 Tax=Lactiplantibacillus songbeiensis TaxID=2559920 RepID=A0ABW4BY78_9LACO|nr:hypothetical protein [Lactiplantibacillus songbeiensis]